MANNPLCSLMVSRTAAQRLVSSLLTLSLVGGVSSASATGVIRIGAKVTVNITMTVSDSAEGPEGESVLVTSSNGWSFMTPVVNGTVTTQFTATANNETLSLQIIGADGDEGVSAEYYGDNYDPDLNDGKSCAKGAMIGDPINAFTGNQYQRVTDINRVARRSFSFERFMNSSAPWPYAPHLNVGSGLYTQTNYHLGSAWTHTYNRFVSTFGWNGFRVHHADGRVAEYNPIGGDPSRGYFSLQEPRGRLAGVPNFGAYGTIVYTSPDNVIEEYNNAYVPYGYSLKRITYPDGFSESITGDLDAVTSDYLGRTLQFGYTSLNTGTAANPIIRKYIRSVRDAAGHAWIYDYEFDPSFDVYQSRYRLAKATFVDSYAAAYETTTPSGPSISYLYGEPGYQTIGFNSVPKLLTGVIDENGARYDSFYYDFEGRNYRAEHPNGADRTVLAFAADYTSTVVSDAYGDYTKSVTYVNLIAASAGTSQPAGSGCAAASSSQTYDTAGNIASADDFNGQRTCYAHDAQGMEIARLEGLPNNAICDSVMAAASVPAGTRKVSTAWHPNWGFKTRVAEPKRTTAWVYNGQQDPTNGWATTTCVAGAPVLPNGIPIAVLCKEIEQATLDADGSQGFAAALDNSVPPRSTSYTYDGLGQIATATDSLGHTTRYFYYTDNTADHYAGDLQSVQNAAGHLTRYPKYDRVGNALQIIGPTGAVTNIDYFPRGWIKSISLTPAGGGQPQVTSYSYDSVGQAKTVTLPGGSVVQLNYDDAHRLVGMADGAGNTITYTLDGLGNRVGEQGKDSTGVLSRNVSRVYDALNRLQSVTGAAQ